MPPTHHPQHEVQSSITLPERDKTKNKSVYYKTMIETISSKKIFYIITSSHNSLKIEKNTRPFIASFDNQNITEKHFQLHFEQNLRNCDEKVFIIEKFWPTNLVVKVVEP